MAIYPKSGNKKVQSFNRGGRYGRPSGAVSNPLVGIGIQYVPTAPLAPNLDAVKYLDQMYSDTNTFMDAEREKRKPNKDAIRDLIFKAPGTVGQKEKLWQDASAIMDEYRTKSKEDPNWVFSDEGQQRFHGIDEVLSPGRFQGLTESNEKLKNAYEQSYKNNTLDQFHIKGDMISVADADGKRTDISLADYEKDQSSGKPKFTALKIQDAYDKAINEQSYDLAGHDVHGDLYNIEQAKGELRDHFANIGYTLDATGHQENSYQRGQAKAQAKQMLSERAKSALQSEYMKNSDGVYKEKEFNQWVDNILQKESQKRAITRDKSNDDALEKARAKAALDNANRILPTEQPVNRDYPVAKDTWLGNKTVDLHMVSIGAPTNKELKPLALNGNYFAFGDTFGGNKLSEEMEGKPVKITNKTYTNASHVENATFAVTSGEILKRNKSGAFESVKTGSPGRIVIKDEGKDLGIPKGAPMRESPEGYTYFENKDGDHVIVEMRAFGVYDIYESTDKDDDELDKQLQVLVPMNRKQSISTLGTNYSGERSNSQYFNGNQITGKGDLNFRKLIAHLNVNDPDEANKLRQALVLALDGNPSARNYINANINAYVDHGLDQEIISNLITQKSEYIPRSASDNRNVE